MTDIKQLLTEILSQHGWHEWREQCCCGWPGERFRETPSGKIQIDATCDEVDEHIADVLLSLPGIAIVDVKSHQNVVPENDLVCYELGGGRSILYSTDDARTIAAALLAAANAAEDADD